MIVALIRWSVANRFLVVLATLALAIAGALAVSGLDAGRLELEITEGAFMGENEATLRTLHQLRAIGVRITMDDFGTGYSSLSYLQCFPFDRIKIDGSFVRDIKGTAASLNIIRAVAAMATGLGMTTTAEGVETEEQAVRLAALGCHQMQGYLFSRPVPVIELPAVIARLHRTSPRPANRRPRCTVAPSRP